MIYLILFFSFFIIGLFTFGGGYAMIPLIEDLVISKEWMTIDEFYSFLGVCESTPGPIAINMATFIGTSQGGLLGAIAATLGVVLPSFIIILLVASLLKKFIDNKTFTEVEKLSMDGRVNELARIIDGVNITQTALDHARKLIENS